MGTVQKVLLYGGTFDPPHNGHMNNLRAALELVRPDKAIVMPAGIPPHKKASTTPGEVRLAMCQCFTALSPAVEVSDWEIAQGGRSYTVHTLEMLRDAYPGAELYLCVGSDMLLTFTQWYRWQDMLAMGPFTPKFVKHFAQVGQIMTDAFQAYDAEVKDASFPAAAQTYAKSDCSDEILERLEGRQSAELLKLYSL